MAARNSGKPKKIGQGDITGQLGINLIERIILEMGFIWNATKMEVGIDGYIEIREPGAGTATNCVIQVQSKATQVRFTAETDSGFQFLCDERDLDYWLKGNAPVILAVSRPSSDEAYWVSVKDYFGDLGRRKARRVVFDKAKDRLDAGCRESLIRLGVPSDSGLYLAPLPKRETLLSNLLALTRFPDDIYLAETECRRRGDVWKVCEHASSAWILKNKQILSFQDLREHPWTKVADRGSVEQHNSREWAFSDDEDTRRDFVQLLNGSLRDLLYRRSVRFDGETGRTTSLPQET